MALAKEAAVLRLARIAKIVVVATTMVVALAHADDQQSLPVDLRAELLGAPVFVSNGVEIGEVSAVELDPHGDVDEVVLTIPRTLGLGTKTVVLRRNSFTALRGAVVVDLSIAEIQALPPISAQD